MFNEEMCEPLDNEPVRSRGTAVTFIQWYSEIVTLGFLHKLVKICPIYQASTSTQTNIARPTMSILSRFEIEHHKGPGRVLLEKVSRDEKGRRRGATQVPRTPFLGIVIMTSVATSWHVGVIYCKCSNCSSKQKESPITVRQELSASSISH